MIKNWNVEQIINSVQKIFWAGSNPRLDGFTTWTCKQDLYRIKWAVDEMLSKMSTYEGEKEFLEEHQKELVWKALKSRNESS